MKISKPENLKKFNSFIDNLTPEDKIALMHDTDADGISAAAIVTKALAKERIQIEEYIIQDHATGRKITDQYIANLEEKNISKLICVDIALEDFIDANKIEIPVLVIDHHQSSNRDSYENFTIYKPSYIQNALNDDEVCAANLAYQLFNSRNDISNLDWIASIGIIGDYTFKQEKDFLDYVFDKYDFKKEENIYDSILGIVVQHLTFANSMESDTAIHKALKAVLKSNEAINTIEELKEFEVVDKEIKKAVDNFEKTKKEHFEDMIIYQYKSPYKINSPVSTIISTKDPKKTFITIQEKNNVYKISARRQDKQINMGFLLKESVKDLDEANGGGHIPAAGAEIQKKDFDKFITKLKEVYLQIKKGNY